MAWFVDHVEGPQISWVPDPLLPLIPIRYGPDAEEISLHSMNAAGYTAEAAFAGEVGRMRLGSLWGALMCRHARRQREDCADQLPCTPLHPYAARKIGVKTVAKAAAKKTAKGVIHKWAGMDSSGAAGSRGGSRSASRGGSRGGSRAGSADNLAAAAAGGAAAVEPAGVGVAAETGGMKPKQA